MWVLQVLSKTPVVIHRAILGSLDRFMAYLIEETKGRFPVWLAPVQAKILLVSEKSAEYADQVYDKLYDAGVRVQLDDRNEKIGYMIRQAQYTERVPYMVIIGEKETQEGTVSVRTQDSKTVSMTADEFVAKITEEIRTRAVNK